MNTHDQGWKELNCEEKVSATISLFGAVLLAVVCVGLTVLLYSAQIAQVKAATAQCSDRTGQKLISETVRRSGEVECRYVRDVTGLAIRK